MATVYLADDLKHERKVALKVLKPELAAVVGAERFLAEIKTTANLTHPHEAVKIATDLAEALDYAHRHKSDRPPMVRQFLVHHWNGDRRSDPRRAGFGCQLSETGESSCSCSSYRSPCVRVMLARQAPEDRRVRMDRRVRVEPWAPMDHRARWEYLASRAMKSCRSQ